MASKRKFQNSLKLNISKSSANVRLHAHLKDIRLPYKTGTVKYVLEDQKPFGWKRLIDELLRTHPDGNLFHCETCRDKLILNKDIAKHSQRQNRQSIFRCGICCKRFRRKSSGRRHLRRHLTIHSLIQLTCQSCGKKIRFQNHCNQLSKVHEREKLLNERNHGLQAHDEKKVQSTQHQYLQAFDGNKLQNIQCHYLQALDGNKLKLQNTLNHDIKVHDQQKLQTALLFQTNDIPRELSFRACKSCQLCGEIFQFKLGLLLHQVVHSGLTNKWSCLKCGDKFDTQSGVEDHLKTHPSGHIFPCKECGRLFTNKFDFMGHGNGKSCSGKKNSKKRNQIETMQGNEVFYSSSVIGIPTFSCYRICNAA